MNTIDGHLSPQPPSEGHEREGVVYEQLELLKDVDPTSAVLDLEPVKSLPQALSDDILAGKRELLNAPPRPKHSPLATLLLLSSVLGPRNL